MSKKFKKTLNNILNVITTIMIVILFFGIISNFQTSFLGKKYNSFFGYSLFEIKTASMSGYAEINDWILVKITDDIKLNDVVTFEEDDSFVTHRVVEIYNDTYVTKGDSNNSNDVPVNKSQIVGKVIKVLPNLGIIKKILLNTKVIVLLLITIILGNSLFVKERTDEDVFSKIKNYFTEEVEDDNNKNENNKKKKNNNKDKVVKEETKKETKKNESDKIYEKYPSLNQLKYSNDLSKTVVLSKVTVKKSKTVKELKELINENNKPKVKNIKKKEEIEYLDLGVKNKNKKDDIEIVEL